MFEFVQLRCFVAVAEELHFGRAASRLNMSQPPLSRHVQQLERVLNVKLLERSSRSVSVTAAGRVFLVEARRILKLAEEAALSARRVADGAGGSLTLGFIPASSYRVLPRLVASMRAEMPDVTLLLKELVTADQVEALFGDRIDVGIMRMPIDPRGLETMRIQRDRYMLAAPAAHPLGSPERDISLSDLDRQPFIMFAPVESRYNYDIVSSIFRSANIAPNFVQYARETHTLLSLVGSGAGLALVPESAQGLNVANVILRDIDTRTRLRSEFTLAWRKHADSPALSLFVDMVAREMGVARSG